MWKVESSDFEHISLHDNFISKVQMDGDDILLIFNEGFDVVKTHPLNDTGKSKLTTAAQIILRNGNLTKGTLLRYIGTENQGIEEEINFTYLLNFTHEIEVSHFHVENGVFSLFSHEIIHDDKMDFLTLAFSCNDVLFCWNDYASDAWFEGWSED